MLLRHNSQNKIYPFNVYNVLLFSKYIYKVV